MTTTRLEKSTENQSFTSEDCVQKQAFLEKDPKNKTYLENGGRFGVLPEHEISK